MGACRRYDCLGMFGRSNQMASLKACREPPSLRGHLCAGHLLPRSALGLYLVVILVLPSLFLSHTIEYGAEV